MIKTENDLQAFEIEDVNKQIKFIFMYDPNNEAVALFNRSDKTLVQAINKNFPFGCISAWEYFRHMWQKSLLYNTFGMKFIGWVDPKTFEPIN